MLLSRSNPDIWARYFDSADVESQGICCGAGYIVEGYTPYSELAVIPPTRNILGTYSLVQAPLGENDDVTFTHQQWLRYSRFEARRCRRET